MIGAPRAAAAPKRTTASRPANQRRLGMTPPVEADGRERVETSDQHTERGNRGSSKSHRRARRRVWREPRTAGHRGREIPNPKHQIPNKFKAQKKKTQN